MKKLFALLLVLVLAFACATTAAAEGEEIKVAFITQSLTNASQAYAWTQFEKYAPEYGFTVQVFDEEYNAENGDRASASASPTAMTPSASTPPIPAPSFPR